MICLQVYTLYCIFPNSDDYNDINPACLNPLKTWSIFGFRMEKLLSSRHTLARSLSAVVDLSINSLCTHMYRANLMETIRCLYQNVYNSINNKTPLYYRVLSVWKHWNNRHSRHNTKWNWMNFNINDVYLYLQVYEIQRLLIQLDYWFINVCRGCFIFEIRLVFFTFLFLFQYATSWCMIAVWRLSYPHALVSPPAL